MSKTTVKTNRIKEKLDSISGLDGDYVQERLDKIEHLVNKYVTEIDKHADENELNGTMWEDAIVDKEVKIK